jgi:hypothetical protein
MRIIATLGTLILFVYVSVEIYFSEVPFMGYISFIKSVADTVILFVTLAIVGIILRSGKKKSTVSI